eukprot:TRINITY_DN17060_c4_g1_i1.p1 TRINITY_DN17060_c4_g1~~TRINITY_DN17060_c4_g1_i1.p1  ORF type:complete len:407 (+),score=94.13 TRINITY_DN17060_c4_g1_i1:104-1324(+)
MEGENVQPGAAWQPPQPNTQQQQSSQQQPMDMGTSSSTVTEDVSAVGSESDTRHHQQQGNSGAGGRRILLDDLLMMGSDEEEMEVPEPLSCPWSSVPRVPDDLVRLDEPLIHAGMTPFQVRLDGSPHFLPASDGISLLRIPHVGVYQHSHYLMSIPLVVVKLRTENIAPLLPDGILENIAGRSVSAYLTISILPKCASRKPVNLVFHSWLFPGIPFGGDCATSFRCAIFDPSPYIYRVMRDSRKDVGKGAKKTKGYSGAPKIVDPYFSHGDSEAGPEVSRLPIDIDDLTSDVSRLVVDERSVGINEWKEFPAHVHDTRCSPNNVSMRIDCDNVDGKNVHWFWSAATERMRAMVGFHVLVYGKTAGEKLRSSVQDAHDLGSLLMALRAYDLHAGIVERIEDVLRGVE